MSRLVRLLDLQPFSLWISQELVVLRQPLPSARSPVLICVSACGHGLPSGLQRLADGEDPTADPRAVLVALAEAARRAGYPAHSLYAQGSD